MTTLKSTLTLYGIDEQTGARKVIDALVEMNCSGNRQWLIVDPDNWASLQGIPQIEVNER
uniref:Uncharacterized protein n=1 Tax=viral metagenome TaxID=1070528 RepID=A0A6M3M0W9_9ZZZZ